MLKTPAGRKYAELLSRHTVEILMQTMRDKELRKLAQDTLEQVSEVVLAEKKPFEPRLIAGLKQALERFSTKASPALKQSLKEIAGDLQYFQGRTVLEGLKAAGGSKPRPSPTKAGPKRKR
jgi:hypothetical protein